jgi:hypothetical protein
MSNPEPHSTALRLTFAYEGNAVTLKSTRTIEMKVPPSHATEGYDGQAGFWVEVRDASDKTVYRRILHSPMSGWHEVHSPEGYPTHVPAARRSGEFEVVVPAAGPGASVVLFGSQQPNPVPVGTVEAERARRAEPRVSTEAASEIARFPLPGATP